MSTLQHILDTGEVHADEPTETLEEARSAAEAQLHLLKDSHWSAFPATACKINQLNHLIEQIQNLLNSRRGLDGMTPVQL